MNLFIRQFDLERSPDKLLLQSEQQSTKPAILLLHGLFGESSNLSRLAKNLSVNYCVFVADLPGHGRSSACEFEDISSMSDTIAQGLFRQMDLYQLDKVAVLGHSLGGKVAMQLVNDYPAYFSHLIVADIAPVKYEMSHLNIFKALKDVIQQGVDSRSLADEILKKYIKLKMIRQYLLKSFIRKEDGWGFKFNLYRLSRVYPELSLAPNLSHTFEPPVMFIKGAQSDFINKKNEHVIYQHYPHAVIVNIENAGHWLHVDQPDVFVQSVIKFIS